MPEKLILDSLNENDINDIAAAFKLTGWNKSKSLYENYLKEQSNFIRSVIVAKKTVNFVGM